MRKAIVLFAAVGLSMSMACHGSEPNGPGNQPAVSAARVAGGVRIINDTSEPFAYAVWNPNFLGLFAPCIDPTPGCLRLAAGDTVVVAPEDIVGYEPGATEAVVRLWRVLPDGTGGYEAGIISEIVVRL